MLRYESYGFYSASPLLRKGSRSLSSGAYRSDRDEERIKEFRKLVSRNQIAGDAMKVNNGNPYLNRKADSNFKCIKMEC
jgi:hypothetical protein